MDGLTHTKQLLIFLCLVYIYQVNKFCKILRFCKTIYWLQILLLAAEYLHLDIQSLFLDAYSIRMLHLTLKYSAYAKAYYIQ